MEPILRMRGISKSFSGVEVLHDVDFDLYPGEVHALVGANGAGKSTLMRILGGIHRPDRGHILLRGRPVQILSPAHAHSLGIALIHQERKLVPTLSAEENVVLGIYPQKTRGWVDWSEIRRTASRILLSQLGASFDPAVSVGQLSVANQQLVEIAKALARQPQVMVFDEPTAALSRDETVRLFEVIGRLRRSGVGVVYISHRLEELQHVADRVTVLRDGRVVAHHDAASVTTEALIREIVGREISEQHGHQSVASAEPVLVVKNLTRPGRFTDINMVIRRGEVVGLAGLVGSGRTSLARSLAGADPTESGEVFIEGRPVRLRSIRDGLKHGIALVPEDRKRQGLVLLLSVSENITMASYRSISRSGWIIPSLEESLVKHAVRSLDIKTRSVHERVSNLSGGNQQKVVLAKWLARQFKVWILDEPTAGIDIGTRVEIYRLIKHLAASGSAVLVISSDLSELVSISDRVYVMRDGRIVGELGHEEASQERILRLATESAA